MELYVLGAVELYAGSHVLAVGRPQQAVVLAALIADVGRPVSMETLVDRVWGQAPPPRARRIIHSHIARLRKLLEHASTLDGEPASVARRNGGYLLEVRPDAVDLHRFRNLVSGATGRADPLREALDLWRGEPMAGLSGQWVEQTRHAWAQQRLRAVLQWAQAELDNGDPVAALPRLGELVAEHPLVESLAAAYMRALYAAGRPADALNHYRAIRDQLSEELGTDPSAGLQQLHLQILQADAALALPAGTSAGSTAVGETGAAVATAARVVPRQLLADPRQFTGRARELARLSAALDEPGEGGAAMVVSTIGGPGGIGKTWLALHWAHRQADRFPDGQLHVNLRGFDPVAAPVLAESAVRGFLDALGVAPAAVPIERDAQAALYRSLVAGRRMLILLDNARDAAQVEPLLPGSATCTVLITSRHRLTSLVATHGARMVELDVLSDPEARDLLAAHLGRERIAAEPHAAAELIAECAGLPLAITIMAARAAAHPGFPLRVLAEELRGHSAQLDAFDGGAPMTNLRQLLSWSDNALSPAQRQVFELLALAPGADIDPVAAASLVALPIVQTRQILRGLEDAYLVQQHIPGRYRMHDLIRRYAVEQARHHQTEQLRDAALWRLIGCYLHAAYTADRLLEPNKQELELGVYGPHCQPQPLADKAQALAWFTAENANLLAAQACAADRSWHLEVWQLSRCVDSFHYRGGHLHDALRTCEAAMSAADHLGDPNIQMIASINLGRVYVQLGKKPEASRHLQRSLRLVEQHSDLSLQARTHHYLAWLHGSLGLTQQALEHATEALRLAASSESPARIASMLNTAGWWHAQGGEFEQARIYCEAALNSTLGHQMPELEAHIRDSLGYIALGSDSNAEAKEHYEWAVTLYRKAGNVYGEAGSLEGLGHAYLALGRHDLAHVTWGAAVILLQAQHRTVDAARLRNLMKPTTDMDGVDQAD
jgi:DNA-binding SARP family transcriptional activator/Tfp pilus assembly protein PilF